LIIRLLGAFEVVGDDGARMLGGLRQRAVLAVLAVHANEVVPVHRLVDDAWSGESPPSAVGTLQRYISHLRKALDGLPATIDTRGPGYVLTVGPDLIDARRFEHLVEAARALSSSAPQASIQLIDEALACWRGSPLADFAYQDFAQPEITRLEELRLNAIEVRNDAALELGHYRDLVPEVEALVAQHPLREGFRGQLMRALHASGRRADALRAYRQGRELLVEELGLEPGTQLQRLEHAILLQDASVEPVETPRVVGGNLPVETTTLIGRDVDIAEVTSRLSQSRLVTLTGPGGSGKTRLALRVASSSADSFPGGVWLVELGALVNPELVPREAANQLGIRDDNDDATEQIIASLAKQQCLIMFDCCEHLLDAVPRLVDHILKAGDGARILATSRELLGVPGETPWPVPPLSVPPRDLKITDLGAIEPFDAARLFFDRADSMAGYVAGDRDAAAIAEICRRLDGIPLAIELAAARTRMLTPAELAGRLDDRFALLTGGARTALPRHRTLRATVEWSYELLTSTEQTVLDRLSVFASVFSLDEAEAVCADEALSEFDVVDAVASLVNKSLLVRGPLDSDTTEYRLLDTIRQFGAERLEESSAEAPVRKRHAAHYLAMATAKGPLTRGPQARAALDVLEARHDDFRAALSWLIANERGDEAQRLAASLAWFWDTRYYVDEGRRWLDQALALPPTEREWWIKAAAAAAFLAWVVDDFNAAAGWCHRGLSRCQESDIAGRARLLSIRAEVTRNLENDPTLATRQALEAAALCRDAGDVWAEANVNRLLTLLAFDRNAMADALTYAAECLRLFELSGDREGIAGARSLLAGCARDTGDFARARELYEDSLVHFDEIGEPLGAALMIRSLATIAVMEGDYDRADRLALESLRRNEHLGAVRGAGESCLVLADSALADGRFDDAAAWCERAHDAFLKRGFEGDVVLALEISARIALARGDVGTASKLAEDALAPYRSHGVRRGANAVLCLLAVLRAREGRSNNSLDLAEEALTLSHEADDNHGVAAALLTRAEVFLTLGDSGRAVADLWAVRTTMNVEDVRLTHAEQTAFDDLLGRLLAATEPGDDPLLLELRQSR
jgi:predicted ATPase/DNA-binding SARP family transcriptional activator